MFLAEDPAADRPQPASLLDGRWFLRLIGVEPNVEPARCTPRGRCHIADLLLVHAAEASELPEHAVKPAVAVAIGRNGLAARGRACGFHPRHHWYDHGQEGDPGLAAQRVG